MSRMSVFAIFMSIFATACGWLPKDHKEQDTINPLDELREKYVRVLALSATNLDSTYHWPSDVSCDGFTFTTIYALAGGKSDVSLAADSKVVGRFYRDPAHACGPQNGTSATTQSQDGFITGALWFWRQHNAQLIKDVLNYINANGSYVGDPHTGVSAVSSAVVNTYNIMLALLQGNTPPKPVDNPNPNPSGEQLVDVTGFRAHLLVWHIFDRGRIYGALNDLEYQLLKDQAARQPNNLFFTAVYNRFTNGDQSGAINALLQAPDTCSTDIQCVPYKWSTDESEKDWAPCPEQHKTFTCIDWLIATSVILGDI